MGKFVLRYQGEGRAPAADVDRVRDLPDAVVLDASSRMLLVESGAEPLQQLVDQLDSWIMAPELTYAVPDTRKKVKGPPD